MKKLMILGASYSQLPLYKAAKQLGYETIAASIQGDYPGFDAADYIAYCDISDPEAVLAAARKYKANGVATCGLDLAMRAIGHVCEELNLNGPSRKAAFLASNKRYMKEALAAFGVKSAGFFCIHNERELEAALDKLNMPVILKAVDQMGGRGIFKSNSKEEALENFGKSMAATKQDYCLVEEFIEGTLFGVEAMLQNGELLFMMPNNTEIFEAAAKLPLGHSVPLRGIEILEDKIKKEVTGAIKALGLDNCPVNCDCILRDGEVYIVELTGRSGATGLSEIVSLKYGIDYYKTIARLAMGEDVSFDFANENDCAVLTHTIASARSGRLLQIQNNNIPNECICELSFNVKPGDYINAFTNGRDRIGQMIIKAQTLSDCEYILSDARAHIRYELEGDIVFTETPIQKLNTGFNENNIYIKREDTLPFSFGGNKVRFADAYFKDMERLGADAMVIYGCYTSNLCRILSTACKSKGIPCSMVHNVDDADPDIKSKNAEIIKANNVREYRCRKDSIAPAVETAMKDFEEAGKRPYYIHGNKFGKGNAHTPMSSYENLYYEILRQERESGINYDIIFLGTSTNTSHSGLLAGVLSSGINKKIVGISVNRGEKRANEVIYENLTDYIKRRSIKTDTDIASIIETDDSYLFGGYGCVSDAMLELKDEMLRTENIVLDKVYTAKAFFGMKDYLYKHNITGKNILFIHTGGTVL